MMRILQFAHGDLKQFFYVRWFEILFSHDFIRSYETWLIITKDRSIHRTLKVFPCKLHFWILTVYNLSFPNIFCWFALLASFWKYLYFKFGEWRLWKTGRMLRCNFNRLQRFQLSDLIAVRFFLKRTALRYSFRKLPRIAHSILKMEQLIFKTNNPPQRAWRDAVFKQLKRLWNLFLAFLLWIQSLQLQIEMRRLK